MGVRVTDNNGLVWNATIEDSELNRIASRIESRMGLMSSKVVSEGDKMANLFSKLATGAAAFFTVQQGSELVNNLIRVRGEFQQLEIAFTTMLQSKEKSNALISELTDLAASTPFELTDVARGAKQLLAYDFAAEGITKNLTTLGNIASGVGAQLGDLVYLYGTLQTQGRAYSVDIKQFAGRGIPIYSELAKVLGVTKDKVAGLVEAGQVGFPQVEKAFQNMTSQGGIFYNLMQEQSKSLTGQISNLKDSIALMFNEIGQGSEGVLSGGIQAASYLVKNYNDIAKILGVLIATYGAYRAAIAIVSVSESLRSKTLATHSHLLSQEAKDNLLATQIIRNKAIALQQEAIAEAESTRVKYETLKIETSIAHAKMESLLATQLTNTQAAQSSAVQLSLAEKELASITATGTARQIANAQKQVEISTKKLSAAEDIASISRQDALATSSDFYAKKKVLETTAIEVNTAKKKASAATNVAMTGITNANAAASLRLTLAEHAKALATTISTKATALLNATMLSNPIVATIAAVAALAAVMYTLHDSTTASEIAQERLNDTLEGNKKSADDLKSKTQELVAIVNDDTQTKAAQILAYQQLQELYKGRLKDLTLEQFKLQGITAQQTELNKVAGQFSLEDLEKQYAEALELVNLFATKQKAIAGGFGGAKNESPVDNTMSKEYQAAAEYAEKVNIEARKIRESEKDASMTIEQRTAYYKEQLNPLQQQISLWESIHGKIEKNTDGTYNLQKGFSSFTINHLLGQFNSLLGKIGGVKKLLDPNALVTIGGQREQIKTLEDDLEKINITDKAAIGKSKSAIAEAKQRLNDALGVKDSAEKDAERKAESAYKKTEKTQTKSANDRKRFLEELTEAERDATINQLTEGEKQVAEVQERYRKMREAAEKAGIKKDNPKNVGVFQRIDNLEKSEIGETKYEAETAKLFESLDEQGQIYADYEAYKTQVGKEEADKRFKNQYKDFNPDTTYLQKLQDEAGLLVQKQANSAINGSSGLTGAEQARLIEANRRIADENKAIFDKETSDRANAITDLATYQQRKAQIINEYNDKIKALGSQATAEQIAEAELQKSTDLHNLQQSNEEKISSLSKYAEEAIYVTKEAVAAQIKTLEEILNNANLPKETKDFVQAKINELKKLSKKKTKDFTDVQFEREIKKQIDLLTELGKEGTLTAEKLQEITDKINELRSGKTEAKINNTFKLFEQLGEFQKPLEELGETIQSLGTEDGGFLSTIGGLISGLASELGNLQSTIAQIKAIKQEKADTGSVSGSTQLGALVAGAQFLIGVFSSISRAAKERKRKEEEYYMSLIGLQHEYNLSLIEQQRLSAELNENVFLTDHVGRIKDAQKASLLAASDYQKSIEKLSEGKAKVGQKNVVDARTVASLTLRGVSAGALVGSALPGIGTVVGAVVGGIVGLIGGLFSKKKKDVYGSLLGQYPELIKTTREGHKEIDAALASQLIKQNLVNDKTKQLLQIVLDNKKALDEARKQMADIVKDLAGNLGNDLRTKLVEAFKAGEDSAKAFGDTVGAVLENVLSNIIFHTVFDEAFDTLQKSLTEDLVFGGLGDITETFANFFKQNEENINSFNTLLEVATQQAKGAGLNIFDKTKSVKNQNSIQGALAAASQESIDLLGGHTIGMRLAQLETNTLVQAGFANSLAIANAGLERLVRIEANTHNTVQELKTLNSKVQSSTDLTRATGGI